jgi:hypothetical protein
MKYTTPLISLAISQRKIVLGFTDGNIIVKKKRNILEDDVGRIIDDFIKFGLHDYDKMKATR